MLSISSSRANLERGGVGRMYRDKSIVAHRVSRSRGVDREAAEMFFPFFGCFFFFFRNREFRILFSRSLTSIFIFKFQLSRSLWLFLIGIAAADEPKVQHLHFDTYQALPFIMLYLSLSPAFLIKCAFFLASFLISFLDDAALGYIEASPMESLNSRSIFKSLKHSVYI